MTTNENERDFQDQGALKRPGRIDLRLFQNIDNAGDGHPGLQKALRNWVNNIHSAIKTAHINNITDIPTRNHNDLQTIGANDHIDNITDIPTRNHNDLQTIGANDHIDDITDIPNRDHADLQNVTANQHHNKQHSITSTADHTSGATSGQMLKGDANGLPIDATNTDAEVSGHISSTANPHTTTLEQARTANNQLSGSVDFNANDIDNLKDIDGNIWFVSTAAELQTAIDGIAGNAGIIILQSGTFTLSASIDVDQTGTYVVIGQGANTIIDCAGNRTAFNITDCASLVMRDFKIMCNDIGGVLPAILVNDSDDSPILIDNVIIDGTGNGQDAYGISVTSDYVTVTNCTIKEIRRAFEITGNYCRLINNTISDIDSPNGSGSGNGTECRVINITGSYCIIQDNILKDLESGRGGDDWPAGGNGGSLYGIYNSGNYNKINRNHLDTLTAGRSGDSTGESSGKTGGYVYGIYNTGTDNRICDNTLYNLTSGRGGYADESGASWMGGPAGDAFGIYNTGADNITDNNRIDTLTGAVGGNVTGTFTQQRGGQGGDATGIYNEAKNKICNNVIDTLASGTGGTGSRGGHAGDCWAIYNTSDIVNINNNIIYSVIGSNGTYGTYGGGSGGDAYGIYNNGGTDCTTNDNNIDTLTGGNGGGSSGPAYGVGNGGSAYGIRYNNGTDGVINGNTGNDYTNGTKGGGGGAGSDGVKYGIADVGTADYNIWTSNNFRGEGEDVTGANNVEANNITA